MKDNTTIWDIETGPGDWEKIESLCQPKITGEPEEGKSRGKSVTKEDNYADWKAACIDKAALSPISGRVLAIGLRRNGEFILLGNDTCDDAGEVDVLAKFWEMAETDFWATAWDKWTPKASDPRWIGFNTSGFDLPFVVTRSVMLVPGFRFPTWLQENGRYVHMWLDLRDRWLLGKQLGGPVRGNLDTMCRALGIPGKNGSGAEFGRLWTNIETRDQARAYLENDIAMTAAAAERLL